MVAGGGLLAVFGCMILAYRLVSISDHDFDMGWEAFRADVLISASMILAGIGLGVLGWLVRKIKSP